MKLSPSLLGIVLTLCLCMTGPALAEKPVSTPVPVKPSTPAQITLTERDAREKVVTVHTTDLIRAVSLASERVPGAVSGNPADVKSFTITYN